MRAPNPRKIDELVTAIRVELKPSRNAREEIEPEVRGWIIALRSLHADDPVFGYWADNQKHAEKLQEWVAQGEALFANMSEGFRRALFYAEWAELFDRTDREVASRFRRFSSLLGWLKRRCSFILQIKAGGSRRTEFEKRRAAMAARYFTERCGIQLVHTNPDKPYRGVAQLFYEAMTGQACVDLRDACTEVARLPNWDAWRRKIESLPFQRRILGQGHLRMEVGDDESPEAP